RQSWRRAWPKPRGHRKHCREGATQSPQSAQGKQSSLCELCELCVQRRLCACSTLSALNVVSIAFSEREAHAQLNVAAIVALRRDAPEARGCRVGITQVP